ncbi:MAG: hypothetical protein HOQ07_01900 [Sinomonas sp.]|nr:hypothetical protein [Sinomonas sp.]
MSQAVLVSVLDRTLLESDLDRAVDAAIERAIAAPGQGILVTRHDHSTFTVEVTADVPQGIIAERDLRPGKD